MSPRKEGGYGGIAMAFHWVTAVLVLVAFIYGPGGSEERIYSPARDFDRTLHEILGLTVLTLTVLRLGWRAFHGAPEAVQAPAWMMRSATAVQGLLYVLLVAVPLTAIAGAWLSGHPLTLGALGSVPSPLPEMHSLGRGIAVVHEYLGDVILWVAGLHAAAALFHHFVLKDGVLLSMLPRRRRGPH